MSDPIHPLSGAVWRRGALLGLIWLAVYAGMTVVLYVLMGLTGWSGTLRALCAMGSGPLVGTVLIAMWWGIRRPTLLPGDGESSESNSSGRGDIEGDAHHGESG